MNLKTSSRSIAVLLTLPVTLWVVLAQLSSIPTIASAGPASVVSTSNPSVPLRVPRFLQKYCLDCHREEPREGKSSRPPSGDFDLTPWVEKPLVEWDRELSDEMRDRVRYFEMPPRGEVQPTEAERNAFLSELDRYLGAVNAATPIDPGPITVRRLNRTEYENTIRDWLGVDFDARELFPADDVGDGFDNNADVLSLSPMLLEKYLQAADTIVARAVFDRQRGAADSIELPAEKLTRRGGKPRRGVHWLSSVAEVHATPTIERAGRYRWTLRAFGQQAGPEPVRCEFRRNDRAIERVAVPAIRSAPGDYSIEADLPAGTPKVAVAFINDYYRPKHKDPKQRDRNCAIVSLTLTGPLDPLDLPAFQARRLPEVVSLDESWNAWEQLAPELLREATRRPAAAEAVDRLRDLVRATSPEKPTLEQLVRATLTALLVSPRFIYRIEVDPPSASSDTRDLDDHELAVRLSYFLWSTAPDDELRRLADEGALRRPEIRDAQVRRMIRDARSLSLAENFATQWLQIRDLTERSPDPKRFPSVDPELIAAMRMETVLLFDAVLREQRPLWDLLEADFSFVNASLAEHYGLPGVRGPWLRRVPIENADRRGLLGHGSVLLATSNPTRTSPVKRGKWILEAILDSPPPPAPPGVDGLTADGASEQGRSLRELLEEHRADPECASCHLRMDALGFGLENFDAVGRWREREGKHPVDASGALPDGRSFSGPAELRRVLRSDSSFLRSVSKQMLTYALGRGTVDTDRPLLERFVSELEADPTFERLILEVTRSEPFRRKRVNR